jgi:predicted PurR-regulated permease PerM
VQTQLREYAAQIAQTAGNLFLDLFGFGAGLLGALFQVMTIGLLTFYLVAYGPQFRRFVCSFLPPQQQHDVLWVWNTAIDKTGAFFYSRLLMAIVNGAGLFVVLSILGVPYPVALAAFTALVSAFIPTIGTYIGGAAPVLVALGQDWVDALIVLGYIVLYQQIENMLIGPKLSGRTMQLNEGVTFGAAILGAYLGGPLMAFLAIPFAAVLQAVLTSFGKRYEVVDSDLVSQRREGEAEGGPAGRVGLRERIRRRPVPEDAPPPQKNGPDDPEDQGGLPPPQA